MRILFLLLALLLAGASDVHAHVPQNRVLEIGQVDVGQKTDFQENSYGRPVSGNVPLAESLSWRTRRIEVTGFYYMVARYYEPNGGRFLSPDPLGHNSSLSLYDYANGDPVNYLDPDGRFGKAVASKTFYGVLGVLSAFQYIGDGLALSTGNNRAAEEALKAKNEALIQTYWGNYELSHQSHFGAINLTFNPAVPLVRGYQEAVSGIGMNLDNFGTRLDYDQKINAAADSFLGGIGTVGAASGLTSLTKGYIPNSLGKPTVELAPMAVGGAGDDVITLFHQGNLRGGQVSSTKPLSMSLSSDLSHYHPGAALNEFQVPRSTYNQWMDDGLVMPFNDLHAPTQIITPELRIMPPESGELNKFLVRPPGG